VQPIFPAHFYWVYLQVSACHSGLYFSVSAIGIILTLKNNNVLLIVFLGFYMLLPDCKRISESLTSGMKLRPGHVADRP
jgi:hypothetical protein